MSRRIRLLLFISTTVGVTFLLAWVLAQVLVVRPSIGEREQARVQLVLEAAAQLEEGTSKREIERAQGTDLRLFHGTPEGPPPGDGWIRLEREGVNLWKREGGKYDIAAWTGHEWVVIHSDLPVATGLALSFLAAALPLIVLLFGLLQGASRQQDLAEAVLARMAEGHLDQRLDEQGGSFSTRRMAVAVNRMAAQLQRLLAADRQRMAGLSHELRTPLTRIRLELELARREGASVDRLARVERDIEAFDSMLGEMLDLSRLQLIGDQLIEREVVDLEGLARMVVDEGSWEDVEVRGSGLATVDSRLVARVVSNLLRNSTQHAPSARRWVEVGEGTICVADDGPGMTAAQRDRAVEPFERGHASAGHGLGLAIVSQIASLHGAELTLSEPPGLAVRIRFPSD